MTNHETEVKKYAMAKHSLDIIEDAICDLHCANELSEKAGFRVPDSVFDQLNKLRESMKEEMVSMAADMKKL